MRKGMSKAKLCKAGVTGTPLYVIDRENERRYRSGQAPRANEMEIVVEVSAKRAVWTRHRGKPPKGMTWEDLYQEVAIGTMRRLKNFRFGGPKSFKEFAYMAACYTLLDIQARDIAITNELRKGKKSA